jgi:hypothetical protein
VELTASCPNCGAALTGDWCAQCGQKRVHAGDLSFGHAVHHLVEEVFHLDGKLWGTMRLLLTRPGELSLDFLEGRRQRHVHPVRLFLTMAALFFLLSNTTVLRLEHIETRAPQLSRLFEAKAKQAGLSKAAYLASRNPVLQNTYKLGVIASVFVVGLLLLALFRRRFRSIGEHLTVAGHNASASFLYALPVGWLTLLIPYAAAPLVASGLVGAAYGYLACRRVYAERPLPTALKVLAVVLFTEIGGHLLAMGIAFNRAMR